MITISYQIVCLRYQSAGEYELTGIKKYSMDEEQAWCPGFSWNFWQILYDPVNRHQDDHVRSWIWVFLMVEVREVVGVGRAVNGVKAWKRQGHFSEGIPWAGGAVGGRGRSAVPQGEQQLWKQLWQHHALVVVLSRQHSEVLYGKGFLFSLGFQPVLAVCAAWIAKYTLLEISGTEDESFLHSVTVSVMDWRGIGSRASSLCQSKQHFWGCGTNLAHYV